MIHTLRKRFIRTTMAVFFAVLLLLFTFLNIAVTLNEYRDIDARLRFLSESALGPTEGMIAITPERMRTWLDLNDAGIMSETSYFIFDGYMTPDVYLRQTAMLSFSLGRDADGVIRSLLAGSRDHGNIGSYRYYVAGRSDPYKLVFLRCDNEFSFIRSLFRMSVLTGLGVFFLALLLVTLLSKRAMQPYAENMENQKRFISNASHELKTPLGVIVSDLDMQMLENGPSEWLENAQMQADHLSLLIDQLISYALLDEKRQYAADIPVELSALASSLLEEFRAPASAGGRQVTSDIRPDVTAFGNEDAFRTLLSVLLENAVKYTPEGGSIRLAVRREKNAVIELSNTCGPIDDGHLDRLFERFYRSPQNREDRGGSGLGLSIAQEITELYGGSIRADVMGGDTLVFTAELPLAAEGVP